LRGDGISGRLAAALHLRARPQHHACVIAPPKVILRCDEAETAKWASDQLGSREIVRTNMTALTGVSTNREGINLQPLRSSEHIVTAGEIQLLQPLEGYLCMAGYDRTAIRVPGHFLRRRQPAFMPRMLRSGKESSAGATQLERAEVWS
jgi:hypothetical protein